MKTVSLKKIFALQPMPFDGIGPSQTCLNICNAAGQMGVDVHLYGTRRRIPIPKWCNLNTPFGNAGSFLPYRFASKYLEAATEKRILADVPESAVVYAWPALRSEIALELKRRNCFIAVEMINIPTIVEKKIIEEEMDREGLHYTHYVTPKKIENQRRILEIADLVFASNQYAEEFLKNYGVKENRIVATRYASAIQKPRSVYHTRKPIFIFVGRICLEKGVHHLLRAWQAAGVDGELHLCGKLDPRFAKQYAELLDNPSVKQMGFCKDIHEQYTNSDCLVFLSLAEGGPQVTIEAAAHGLPMIVSPMGGGRIADHNQTAIVIDPRKTELVRDSIRKIAASPWLQKRLGEAAFIRAREFTWEIAAKERISAIANPPN